MKLIELIKNFAKHELVNGSFFILIGGLVASVLAFLLNLYFARTLTYQDYGILTALITIVALLIIPSGSISAIISKYATAFFAKKQNERAGAFYKKSFKGLFIISILFTVIFLLLSPLVLKFLKIHQPGLLLITALAVAIFYLSTLNMAFLQSQLKFKLIGLIQILSGMGRLIAGVVLVSLGFNVYGAIFATLVLSLVNFAISVFPLRKVVANAGDKVDIGLKDFTKYAVPTSVSIFAFSLFVSSDVLLVKHYFSSVDAGLYGGLALVGRVIFYFTGPIAIAMFPLIVKRQANNEKFNNLFHLALLLVLLPSICITIFYFVLPNFTLHLFLGGKEYLQMSKYLGLYGVFITIFSVNNVFVNFFLSIKKTAVTYLVVAGSILQIILILIFHSNFYEIIYVSIASSVLLLISLLLYYLWINKSDVKKHKI